ncbi:MAG: MATE family efflux transporter [Mucinivorans sp.]
MIRKIIGLAIPNIISNITIPLVGMVDLAIVGAMGSTVMLGGIAIGTAIFNLLYWNFGFLRMGTSGLTAQAYGRRDFVEIQRVLMRSLSVATAIAALILLFQVPLVKLILRFMDTTPPIELAAREYFTFRVWAAPATLGLYAFKGWLIGMQNSRSPMWIAIFINVVNVVASLVLAFPCGMGLAGVALGTTIAQWSGVGLALFVVARYYGRYFDLHRLFDGVFQAQALALFFRLNRDIFIRTLCLVAVFTYFTKASSSMGPVTLAANTLLMQLFTIFSYFMDGFAYAGEALAGRYTGSRNMARLRGSVVAIFKVGGVVSLFFSVIYFFVGRYILLIFSPSADVLARALSSMVYVALVPVVGFSAFLLDGLLVGMTQSRVMRNSMLVATALFFGLYFALDDILGTGALWLAFLSYLLARAGFQLLMMRPFTRKNNRKSQPKKK